ncbi:MAG: hypothetical protein MRJ93_12180 [Nitrososphaeraceae archaeon]|nr:hypothetical protein [Nitrososphaeraceae archaeon]
MLEKIVNKILDIIRIEKGSIYLEYSNNQNRITNQNTGQHDPSIKISIITAFLLLNNKLQKD